MSRRSTEQIETIFQQLDTLRTAVSALQCIEERHPGSLRGGQTVDDAGARDLSFRRLNEAITDMQEVLITLAEAAGDIAKL